MGLLWQKHISISDPYHLYKKLFANEISKYKGRDNEFSIAYIGYP